MAGAGVDPVVDEGAGVVVFDDVDGVDGVVSIGVGAVTPVSDGVEDSSNFFIVMIKLRLAHWSV